MLKTEQNTAAMRTRILKAARKFLNTRKVDLVFDRQWWMWDLRNNDNYSVVDAEGPGTIDSFDFEQV